MSNVDESSSSSSSFYEYQSSHATARTATVAAEQQQQADEQELHYMSQYFVFFAFLLAVVLVSNKYLKESIIFSSYISEPALTLGIGTVVGFVIWLLLPNYGSEANNDDANTNNNVLAHSLLSFSPNVFFMALLPPILFNSGYQLRRELFYRHIKPILLFACLGTTICALATSLMLYGIYQLQWLGLSTSEDEQQQPLSMLELLTFGSLIAATDTVSVLGIYASKQVDPHLFYLVFGESALNDAVAMILFVTFSDLLLEQQQRNAAEVVAAEGNDVADLVSNKDVNKKIALKIGGFVLRLAEQAILSPLLGVLFAFLAALVFKHVDLRRHASAELPLYMLLMYTPFVLAECIHLSGIVAIFFCGMSARRYIVPNVSIETKKNANVLFPLAAHLSETCIFLELGLSVFGLPGGSFNWSFIAWAFLASLVGRAMGIYPLVFVYNYCLTETTTTTPADGKQQQSQAEEQETNLADDEVYRTIGRTLSGDDFNIHTPVKRQDKHISWPLAHMIWFAGLRGAVAYACVRKFPTNVPGHTDEFTAATMSIVLISIILMGGTTEYLLRALGIATNIDYDVYMQEWRKKRTLKGTFHELENKYVYSCVVRDCTRSSDAPPGSDEWTVGSHQDDAVTHSRKTQRDGSKVTDDMRSSPLSVPYDESDYFRRLD